MISQTLQNAGMVFTIVTGTLVGGYQVDEHFLDKEEAVAKYQTLNSAERFMSNTIMFQTQTTATLLDMRARELQRIYNSTNDPKIKAELREEIKNTSKDMTELAANFDQYYESKVAR